MRTDAAGNKRKYYYDGINTLLTREKPVGAGTCYRTATANVLKNTAIGQIITQKQYSYATDNCTQSPTSDYIAYHYDHIGNVVAVTECDGFGTLVEAYDMDAFGTMHQGSQDGVRLTTKEYDLVSGLYYFGARWYDPVAGRWVEKEPLRLDGPNLYHYVFNNPISSFDISGLQGEVVDIEGERQRQYNRKCAADCHYLIDTKGIGAYQDCVRICKKRYPHPPVIIIPQPDWRLDNYFDPSIEDLNPCNNPLMYIPIGAAAAACCLATGGLAAPAFGL